LLATSVVLALTGPACSGGGGSDCTSENATKLTGTLMVKGNAFNPNCFSVASGSTISVANDDAVPHTFTVTDTDVDVPLPAGETGEATAPAPGTHPFVCTIHRGMTGTVIVT
jgi:plastocyanin